MAVPAKWYREKFFENLPKYTPGEISKITGLSYQQIYRNGINNMRIYVQQLKIEKAKSFNLT